MRMMPRPPPPAATRRSRRPSELSEGGSSDRRADLALEPAAEPRADRASSSGGSDRSGVSADGSELRRSRAGRERRRPQRSEAASRAAAAGGARGGSRGASEDGDEGAELLPRGTEPQGGIRRAQKKTTSKRFGEDADAYGGFDPPSKAAAARLQRSKEKAEKAKAAEEAEKENARQGARGGKGADNHPHHHAHHHVNDDGTPKRPIRHREAPPYSDVMRVSIQGTGPLEPVEWLCSPVVRMHLVSQETGEYYIRSAAKGEGGQKVISGDDHNDILSQPERPMLMSIPRFGGAPQAAPPPPPPPDPSAVEAGAVDAAAGGGGAAAIAPPPPRSWEVALLDFITAFQTEPYNLRQRPHSELAASWDEEITVDEDPELLRASDVMLLFEVLQPPESMASVTKVTYGGMQPLAWAFLKLRDHDGRPITGTMKLQLYNYAKGSLGGAAGFLKTPQPPLGPRVNQLAKEAYSQWWKQQIPRAKSSKYPSFLQVNLDVLPRVEPEVVVSAPAKGLRPSTMLGGWGGYEMGRYDLLAEAGLGGIGLDTGLDTPPSGDGSDDRDEASELRSMLARPSGAPCLIPNALFQRFPGTPLGATTVAWAHESSMIAVAVGGTYLWGIQVWEVMTGSLMVTLTGHHEMIYDLCWSPDDLQLLTASSDYTAKVWDVSSLDPDNPRAPVKRSTPVTLQHASFVYCGAFHPADPRIVATGCYDHSVNLWDHEAEPPVLLHSVKFHTACVNSLLFDSLGKRLYSADGDGFIRVWSSDSRTQSQGEGLRFLKLLDELRDQSIVRLQMHPNNRRMLAITRRSTLVTFDVAKLFSVNSHYSGLRCGQTNLQPCFSPDGRYIICGSEDGRVYLWDVERHEPHCMGHISFKGPPVCCVSWSPGLHCLAICTFTPMAPIQVYSYKGPPYPQVQITASPYDMSAAQMTPGTVGLARPSTARSPAKSTLNLPDKLTPEHLADMLASIRSSVRARGMTPTKTPLRDEKLVVAEGTPNAKRSPLAVAAARRAPGKSGATKRLSFDQEEEDGDDDKERGRAPKPIR